jgi:hypothetical protein
MDLGGLTMQLAQQALTSATQEPVPTVSAVPGNAGAVILNQIGAMQAALKEDEELLVALQSGTERIRILEIYLPSPQVAVLTGVDSQRVLVRVVSAIEALQLAVRSSKAPAGAKPVRVNLVVPKAKDSGRK